MKISLREFLIPSRLSVPLKGQQDQKMATLNMVVQVRVDSALRFSEDPNQLVSQKRLKCTFL